MSRVTEFSDDDERLQEEPDRGADSGKTSFKMPNLSLGGRIKEFYHAVKLEMAKTTWPTRTEVWSTTVVVFIAIIFFGFYLWGVDMVVTVGFEALEKAIR